MGDGGTASGFKVFPRWGSIGDGIEVVAVEVGDLFAVYDGLSNVGGPNLDVAIVGGGCFEPTVLVAGRSGKGLYLGLVFLLSDDDDVRFFIGFSESTFNVIEGYLDGGALTVVSRDSPSGVPSVVLDPQAARRRIPPPSTMVAILVVMS